ncbi:MAG: lipopolysaccharide biosynthesis protein, partial [Burkholderiales bacterium PBB4]
MAPPNEYADQASGVASDAADVTFLDMALGIAKNLRLLFFVPILAGLLALGSTYLIKPTFSARTVILPPQQQQSAASLAIQSLGALASVAGVAAGVRNPADQYIALMQSQSVEDRLIDTYKLQEVYKTTTQTAARRALEANTRIGAGKKDGLITVEVDDLDPARAAALANAYVSELGQLTKRLAVPEAQVRRQ